MLKKKTNETMENSVFTENANKVVTSVDSIAKTIQDLFTSLREPAKQIPAITLLCSLVQRPGLSSNATTARIITRLGGLGLPTSKMPDGSENMMNQVIGVIVDEIFKALKYEANIQGACTGTGIIKTVGVLQ